MAPRVVLTDCAFADLEIEEQMLAAAGAEFIPGSCRSSRDVIELSRDADIMLNHVYGRIDDEVIAACHRLRLIVRVGVGVDTIDVAAATRHGVMVANVPDYCMDEVSDHAITLWLTLARHVTLADRRIHAGDWNTGALQPLPALRGQTVGIVGLGRIGRYTARKLATFGVRILYCDPYVPEPPDLGGVECERVALEELCREADAIFLHAPGNEETHHLLDAERFAQMDRHPIIINTARAALINTDDLVTALAAAQVRAAGLDLVDGEKLPADHPLLPMDNVVITPHFAWYSEESGPALRRLATLEVIRVLEGKRPKSLVNPEALEHTG